MKKGTKLTDNPKDYMLRVRMDKETVEKLDKICEVEEIGRSEAVRNGIEEQYQKLKKQKFAPPTKFNELLRVTEVSH